MKTITVCVGSSCHMKGSHYVIDALGELIEKYNLQGGVDLKASFCMRQCTGNIGAEIDGVAIPDLTLDNVKKIFEREFLNKDEKH